MRLSTSETDQTARPVPSPLETATRGGENGDRRSLNTEPHRYSFQTLIWRSARVLRESALTNRRASRTLANRGSAFVRRAASEGASPRCCSRPKTGPCLTWRKSSCPSPRRAAVILRFRGQLNYSFSRPAGLDRLGETAGGFLERTQARGIKVVGLEPPVVPVVPIIVTALVELEP
jgi:hypothetical protein